MVVVVDKLIDYSSSQDEDLRDIAGLGKWNHSILSPNADTRKC